LTTPNNTPWRTLEEAAEYLRVCHSTFKKHVRPKVPCSYIGDKPVWHTRDLDAFMTDHTHFVVPRAGRGKSSARARFRSTPGAAKIAQELG
jgi:hypothetical protein